jgi:hypothetical protein
MAQFNRHSAQRAAQRNLSPEKVRYVITYGRQFRRAGALIYYLRRRDVPEWDRADDHWMRLAGTAVILTKDGRTVITVWRNRHNGLKRIRRKPEYDALRVEQEHEEWLV